MTYFITRISVAIIFLYHGLVPKLLYKNSQEILMNNTLMPFVAEAPALLFSGIAEVLYAIALVVFYRSRALMYPTMVFSVLVTIALIFSLPGLFQNAFNPFTINLSIFVLALINTLESKRESPLTRG